MNTQQILMRYGPRALFGTLTIVIGALAALGAIALILYVDGTVTDATGLEVIVSDEASAQAIQRDLSNGASAEMLLETYGDAIEEANADLILNDSALRRKRIENYDSAADAIFSVQDKGTVLGPYPTRRAYYLFRIEDQSVVGLGTIYELIDERVLSNSDARANVVDFWLPIVLCSCGLLLTFSAGLWNIGIEGQVGMGAIGASSVALFADLPRNQMIITELVVAAAAGGVWALLTAMMRTRAGVNEIFGGVAMNFIATGFSSYLLVGPWGNGTGSSTPRFPEKALLPRLNDQSISPVTLGIVLTCFLFVLLILTVSRWGLELRAIGKNSRSAQVLGIPTERNIWVAMTLCGMMAGLSGAHLVIFTQGKLPANVSGGIGFLALLVVLLASIRVILVPFIALVFALLTRSGLPLLSLDIDRSLVGVFIGVLVLFVLIFGGIRQQLQERVKHYQSLRQQNIKEEG